MFHDQRGFIPSVLLIILCTGTGGHAVVQEASAPPPRFRMAIRAGVQGALEVEMFRTRNDEKTRVAFVKADLVPAGLSKSGE